MQDLKWKTCQLHCHRSVAKSSDEWLWLSSDSTRLYGNYCANINELEQPSFSLKKSQIWIGKSEDSAVSRNYSKLKDTPRWSFVKSQTACHCSSTAAEIFTFLNFVSQICDSLVNPQNLSKSKILLGSFQPTPKYHGNGLDPLIFKKTCLTGTP